jgi:hypothetical protein
VSAKKARYGDLAESLDVPTPGSILRAFPPAPADPAQWSSGFFAAASPIPVAPTNHVLLTAWSSPEELAPVAPQEGTSPEELAAYVAQACK